MRKSNFVLAIHLCCSSSLFICLLLQLYCCVLSLFVPHPSFLMVPREAVITKTRLLKLLQQEKETFQIKNSDMFHISAQNIDCGYSLEQPRRGGSN